MFFTLHLTFHSDSVEHVMTLGLVEHSLIDSAVTAGVSSRHSMLLGGDSGCPLSWRYRTPGRRARQSNNDLLPEPGFAPTDHLKASTETQKTKRLQTFRVERVGNTKGGKAGKQGKYLCFSCFCPELHADEYKQSRKRFRVWRKTLQWQ